MMKRVYATASLLAGLSLSGSALAGNCADDAALNAKFADRANLNFNQLKELRDNFKIKFNEPRADKIECATYIGRIDILRGGLLPELENISIDNQKQALDDCLSISAEIKSTNSAEYHYFYNACLAFRGKLEGLMGRIKYGLMARESKGPALEVARNGGNFEAGGIYRVMSALSGNRLAKPLGLYNSEEALQFAKFSLATPARNLPPFSTPLSGTDFYENHYYKAQALIATGVDQNQKSIAEEGNRILGDKIEEIDFLNEIGELGERSKETLAYQEMIKKLKAKADSCLPGSDWNQCLIDRLNE